MDNLQISENFWRHLQTLVETSEIVIDRPKGTPHPDYPGYIHPVDYGFLKGTSAADGGGIDVWVGSSGSKKVEGIICIVDMEKRDSEIKILFSCSEDEIKAIYSVQSQENMSAVLIKQRGTE